MVLKPQPILSKLKISDVESAGKCLRDIVALSTMPVIWSGAEPRRIAESLAASLFTVLDPEFVFIAFTESEGSPILSIAQTDRYHTSPELAERLRPLIFDWIQSHDPDELLILRDTVSSGRKWRVTAFPLGLNAELGVIAAGFADKNSPTQVHRLLLNVGANQAASAVRNARLMCSLHESQTQVQRANRELSERLEELQKINLEFQESRRAALNLMEDAVLSRQKTEILNSQLREEIAERKSLEQQIAGQKKILEAVALGKPLEEILHLVKRSVERQLPDSLCCILLANEDQTRLFTGAAQSLPAEYNSAINDLAIGENRGSCGTAAFRREAVIVSDTFRDPLWTDFRDLAKKYNLRACWSHPIASPAGKLLGTFATYFKEVRKPQPEELAMIVSAARLAGIAIERRQSEESLRLANERFETVAQATNDAIWDWNLQTDQLWWNDGMRALFGYEPEQIGDSIQWWYEHLHPEDRERVIGKIHRVIEEGGQEWSDEYRFVKPDGSFAEVFDRGFVIRDADSKPVRMTGGMTDISERKFAEAEREKLLEQEKILREQAEQANRLKDEFLATVSHELRTPLNAILGWALMVRQNNYNSEIMRRAFEVIERNARNQNQIISDILDVSRIITGKLTLNLQPVALSEIIRAAIDTMRPAIEAKGIDLEISLEPDTETITGDADRLQQVVWNLLSNAVKFTPEGGKIEIRSRFGENCAEITVTDNGSGIESEFIPFVFDRFRQADGKMNRRHGGLGLGLAVVRHLTEMHGGSVAVESDGAGKGSVFTVRLPLKTQYVEFEEDDFVAFGADPEKFSDTAEVLNGRLEGLKILVVDDDLDSLELVNFILSEQGAEVFPAQSVDGALEIFDRENPDFLISDLGMPEKDGYQLIREIKKRANGRNRLIPAVAMTAYARKEDNQRVLQSGYVGYLPKPVEPFALVEKIVELTR